MSNSIAESLLHFFYISFHLRSGLALEGHAFVGMVQIYYY